MLQLFFTRLFMCSSLLLLAVTTSRSQQVITEMDHDAHYFYDRMIIRTGGGVPGLHSAIRPFWRDDLVLLADSFSLYALSPAEHHMMQAVRDQNNEFVTPPDSVRFLGPAYRTSRNPLWNTFYKTPAHFYEVDVKDFYLRVNPMIRLMAGRETNEGVSTFINQRGISLRGGVGKNVFFQTSLYDSQVRFPNYVNQFTDTFGVVPGAGLFKNFESAFFDFGSGRDFLLANAYVGINLGKYIGLQLGHNQFFLGDGMRSLLLSDFSTPYFSLKINTRIWKLHYQNIFAELSADNFMSVPGFSGPVPKKYMAAHYLSFKPSKTVTVGLFESVMFNRPGNQFELQYLNPVILYRTVEGSIGSPDNVILGLTARVDIEKTVSVYGQFILDDIIIRNILRGDLDWWGNKFGHQLGIKYPDAFGIHFLDAWVEWNQVRPYTFSHVDENANYSNYRQPLAHPLGANFNEWIFSLRYQAAPRIHLHSRLYLIKTGEDRDSISFGGNVLLSNTLRPGDFGHTIGQGVGTDIVFWSSGLQYEFAHGVFVDAVYILRDKKSELPVRNLQTHLFQLGVRYNMARREDVF